MLKEQIDSLLDRVQKPARYMGGEMNCVLKDPNRVDIRYAFAFPDVYEVGMSHLGSRILYDIINKQEDALCERVFMPWVDMADLMRQEGVPLFSLETRSPVGGFDMLGFTLQYEMSYTNILEMLDLSGIPLRSEDRTWEHPIVIAGGPCAFNPEPLYAFIDAFSIGDGEISTLETIDVVKQCKQEGVSREECLRRLSRLHGVYVPSLYRAEYHADGTLASFEPTEEGVPRTVVKNMIANIDTAAYPESIIVPFMEIVHDRINIEVLRGCTRGGREGMSCYDMLMTVAPCNLFTIAVLALSIIVCVASLTQPAFITYRAMRVLGRIFWLTLRGITASLFLFGAVTMAAEWKRIAGPVHKKILYTFTFPLFMLTYVPISVAALVGKVEWRPIRHGIASSNSSIES